MSIEIATSATSASVSFENRSLKASSDNALLELLHGLEQEQKTISPKYFYDQKGSELFEQITQTLEYYPTRTERGLLSQCAQEIADYSGEGCVLIEPGSGSCEKVRLILDELQPSCYVPIDISSEFLYRSANQLAKEYPWLDVRAICSDFYSETTPIIPAINSSKTRLVFYPGSTIGNMKPLDAIRFLARIRSELQRGDLLLMGVDLLKNTDRLNAAYNDSAGITAAFNLNVLNHLNHLFDSDFDLSQFEHQAFFNEQAGRVEMHLVSRRDQLVSIAGRILLFKQGETIHTENSYKYSPSAIDQLGVSAGMKCLTRWVDEAELFSLTLFAVP